GDSIGAAIDPNRPDAADAGEERDRLLHLATRCKGLIICIDAHDRGATGLYFDSLNRFLRDVAASTEAEGRRLPFERVAVVLTKADRLVADAGVNAEAELARLDPVDYARGLLGRFALSDLFTHLDEAARRQVYCGWASVYGFIPNDKVAREAIEKLGPG